MEMKAFGRIGVLMGGPSSEREISLKSGKAVFAALTERGLDAVAIDITSDDRQENISLIRRNDIDCAFIALHGRFGEDGTIQEVLEELNLPFTASGVKASRLAMDKIGSLRIFTQGGLCVPKSQFLQKTSYQKDKVFINQLGLPLVIKPANHGSSIGLSLVENIQDLPAAIELAFQFDEHIVIQEYIRGRELTVGILDGVALPVIEIIPENKFFDFVSKYQSGSTRYIVPAVLDFGVALSIQREAQKAHNLLGCYGCSRVDFILAQDGRPYILEINTIPGMTATSLLPKAAKIMGIDFGQLCYRLLELAYESRHSKGQVNEQVKGRTG
jgi:D-alanine-D-alanine ligase